MSLEYNKTLIKNAKELRKAQTPQERRLWYEFLSKYPIRFQRQKAIDNYIVDFYCAKAKLVIELDGGGHYEAEQLVYDEKRTALLQTYKLRVLRFTNSEINSEFYNVCTLIDNSVKNSLPQSPAGDSSLV